MQSLVSKLRAAEWPPLPVAPGGSVQAELIMWALWVARVQKERDSAGTQTRISDASK